MSIFTHPYKFWSGFWVAKITTRGYVSYLTTIIAKSNCWFVDGFGTLDKVI